MPAPQPASAAQTASSASSTGAPKKSFLDEVFDIVNPLQHIPIVSTIYSAVTGDKPDPFAQIAGDTLYGGAMGFMGSMANQAFTQIAGKSVGDMALAMFEGDKNTQVATAAPAATYLVQPSQTNVASAEDTPQAAPTTPVTTSLVPPANEALMASLKDHGVDADLALRASYAYRQAVNAADISP
ncbi:MAG TPA: hypothetical protein VK779_00580 [Rhizomicrobium sp.]|nr:hypothetical protein [Rhizomicrobium sp.]